MSKNLLLKKEIPKRIKKLQKEVWEECKRIIKIRNGNICYTCKKECKKSNRHTGHMFNKKWCGLRMKFDLRILNTQCYFCNINLGSNGATFAALFIQEKGLLEFVEVYTEVMLSKTEKWVPIQRMEFLEKTLQEYKSIVK